jgi:hypothetical protein
MPTLAVGMQRLERPTCPRRAWAWHPITDICYLIANSGIPCDEVPVGRISKIRPERAVNAKGRTGRIENPSYGINTGRIENPSYGIGAATTKLGKDERGEDG